MMNWAVSGKKEMNENLDLVCEGEIRDQFPDNILERVTLFNTSVANKS
jgi:hypothetical protein